MRLHTHMPNIMYRYYHKNHRFFFSKYISTICHVEFCLQVVDLYRMLTRCCNKCKTISGCTNKQTNKQTNKPTSKGKHKSVITELISLVNEQIQILYYTFIQCTVTVIVIAKVFDANTMYTQIPTYRTWHCTYLTASSILSSVLCLTPATSLLASSL